jgi:TonB family protein
MLLRSAFPSLLAPPAESDAVPPARRRARRKRWALGLGLSLAAHCALVSALVVKARHEYVAAGEAGQLGADMVRVEPVDEAPSSFAPRATDDAPAVRDAPALARPARRAGSPGRPLRVATTAPIAAPALPRAAPEPAPLPADPAEEAARAAFRATLRKHLYQAWRAGEVYQRIDPQGRLAGSLFTTAVQVRLRPDGRIERSEMRESSGLPLLDKEALGALERLQPLPPVPAGMLDAQGGWPVLCKFYLDVGMFRFAGEIRRALRDRWRPSPAFARTAESERRTVIRILENADGTVVSSNVMQSSGMQMLDDNAVHVVKPGDRLPPPPRALVPKSGPAQVFVAFLHQAGDIRVMKPREDVEDE